MVTVASARNRQIVQANRRRLEWEKIESEGKAEGSRPSNNKLVNRDDKPAQARYQFASEADQRIKVIRESGGKT